MVTSPFAKIRDAVRQLGYVIGMLYLADRALQAISPGLRLTVFRFVAQPISAAPLLPARFSKGLTYELIGPGRAELDRMPRPREVLDSRFAQGARCLGAFRDGKMVGYIWLCFDLYKEDMARCDYHLADPVANVFDFDLYVPDEHRMGLGFPAVWQVTNEYLNGLGVRHSLSRIDRFNIASYRAHLRLGARPIGTAVFLAAGPVELMIASVRPFVHLSLSRRRRSQIRLSA